MKIKQISKFLKFFIGASVVGITLAPFGVYVKRLNDKLLINHELIHWKQQIEMLILPFYLWYIIEWFIRIFINGRDAYVSLSFEREAYSNEKNLDYLKNRKSYAWIKYLLK